MPATKVLILILLVTIGVNGVALGGGVRIEFDSPEVLLGTAATGRLVIWAAEGETLTLSKGVSLIRGAVAWNFRTPSGTLMEMSDLYTGIAINAFIIPIEVSNGDRLNVPVCLFCGDRGFIFDQPGEYEITVTLQSDQLVPLTHTSKIIVLEETLEYSKWKKAFKNPYSVLEAFSFPTPLSYFTRIGLEENGGYVKSVDQLYVYSYGRYIVGRFLRHRSADSIQERFDGVKLKEHIEMGLSLSQKTGYGRDLWGYISQKYNKHFSSFGEIEVENRDFGRWALR